MEETKPNITIRQGQFSWDLEKEGFYFFGIPSVLLWTNPSMLKMLQHLAQEVGFDMFRLMVAHSSSFGTTEDYHNVVMPLGNGDFIEGFYAWGRVISSIGWGNVEVKLFDTKRKHAIVKIRNPWELSMQAQTTENWGCPFIQGKIMGLFSEAFGVNCWATEREIYINKEDSSKNFIEFYLEPSEKTIGKELDALRIQRMQAKERALTEEVAKKTGELAEAHQQLALYSQELEKKVQDRTAQLQETMEELNQINEELATQADELVLQKKELRNKNHTITESINYAKRIQNATLPSDELFKSYFPNGFVWYVPRDIVSGDFYWIDVLINTQGEKEFVLAVGDCTGHGVSGCLMSMIGNNSLHQIVSEKKIHHPAQILTALDSSIRKLLKQDTENIEIRDGMDLGLCIYNPTTKILRFSSAKRPLWIIRQNELEQIKGSIIPIGSSFYEKKTFEEHIIPLYVTDRVYLFSDGLVDQFDKEDNRRFGSKRLKQTLLQLQAYPLASQKEHLSNNFYEWKGNTPQTDDLICVAFEVTQTEKF